MYKEVTSNDIIISSSSMETFLIKLENVKEFLLLLLLIRLPKVWLPNLR